MSDEIKQQLLQTFTCEICIEPALLTHKFRHSNDCVHNICFECIASHIQAKIDENISTINCPKLDCGKILIPLECRPIIPSALFVKWCDCLCKSFVSAYTSCYCPYRDCSELILNECNKATTKCACPWCKRLVCYACRVSWHAGFRCNESSQERDASDVQFGRLVEKMEWKRCPNCGHPIELTGGCRHVKCRCGTQFCYLCGLRHSFLGCEIEDLPRPMIILMQVAPVFCLVVICIVFYEIYLYIMASRGE